MILDKLTLEAEFAAARYTLLTESWRSLFNQALGASDFGSPAAFKRLTRDAFSLAETFLAEEQEASERVLREIAIEAHQTTLDELQSVSADELSDAALEHLRVTQSYMLDELAAQMHRDVALLRQTLQRVVLEVSLAARSRQISERTALIEYRIGNQAELSFVFNDRQSRRWSSKKFVRALWRHTLLSVYNEIVLTTLADHGIQRARVVHQDAKADVHDMVIAFGSNTELPTYSEIREGVFHPNAHAFLAMEDSRVSS